MTFKEPSRKMLAWNFVKMHKNHLIESGHSPMCGSKLWKNQSWTIKNFHKLICHKVCVFAEHLKRQLFAIKNIKEPVNMKINELLGRNFFPRQSTKKCCKTKEKTSWLSGKEKQKDKNEKIAYFLILFALL